jgi:hypothetical protein
MRRKGDNIHNKDEDENQKKKWRRGIRIIWKK